jgi:hypothetical protein
MDKELKAEWNKAQKNEGKTEIENELTACV